MLIHIIHMKNKCILQPVMPRPPDLVSSNAHSSLDVLFKTLGLNFVLYVN